MQWPKVLLILALIATGCPRSKKRQLPADPPDMKRAAGTKLSIPLPDGFQPVTEGSPEVREAGLRGGVTIVRQRPGAPSQSIAADVGETATDSWSRSECKAVAKGVAGREGATVQKPEVIKLPTGKTCHFTTEAKGKRPREFYYVAGEPPVIVACLGRNLSADCRYVASWIRMKP